MDQSELRAAFVLGVRWHEGIHGHISPGEAALLRYPEPKRLREIVFEGGARYRYSPSVGWEFRGMNDWIRVEKPTSLLTSADYRLVADCWENPWEG